MHERDRRTDGQTDTARRLSHGKNKRLDSDAAETILSRLYVEGSNSWTKARTVGM